MEYDKWLKSSGFRKGLVLMPNDEAEEGTYRVWFQTSETEIWEFYTKNHYEASHQMRVKKGEDSDRPVQMAVRKNNEWERVEALP